MKYRRSIVPKPSLISKAAAASRRPKPLRFQAGASAYRTSSGRSVKAPNRYSPSLQPQQHVTSADPTKKFTHVANQLEVLDLASIKAFIDRLPANSLIAWDLDNTVIEPQQLIGSDQWFEAFMRFNIAKFGEDNKSAAIKETIDVYNYVHQHSEVTAVEPGIVALMQELTKSHRVIAITTRGKELVAATFRQLSSIGVKFNVDGNANDNNHEIYLDQILLNSPHSTATNSVIFAGGRSKADCLKAYLNAMGIKPEAIPYLVFVDDKKHHVENISRCAQELGIPSTCFHYRHLEHKIPLVHLPTAEVQLRMHQAFGKFVSDDLAKAIATQLVNKGVKLETAAVTVVETAAAAHETQAAPAKKLRMG
jgi:hypothetical protein